MFDLFMIYYFLVKMCNSNNNYSILNDNKNEYDT